MIRFVDIVNKNDQQNKCIYIYIHRGYCAISINLLIYQLFLNSFSFLFIFNLNFYQYYKNVGIILKIIIIDTCFFLAR